MASGSVRSLRAGFVGRGGAGGSAKGGVGVVGRCTFGDDGAGPATAFAGAMSGRARTPLSSASVSKVGRLGGGTLPKPAVGGGTVGDVVGGDGGGTTGIMGIVAGRGAVVCDGGAGAENGAGAAENGDAGVADNGDGGLGAGGAAKGTGGGGLGAGAENGDGGGPSAAREGPRPNGGVGLAARPVPAALPVRKPGSDTG